MLKIPRARVHYVGRHGKEQQHKHGDRARRTEEGSSYNPFVPGAAGMQSAFGLTDLEADSIVSNFPRARPSAKQKKFHNRQKPTKHDCPPGLEVTADGKRKDQSKYQDSGFGGEYQKSLDGTHGRNREMSILSPYFGGWAEGGAAAGFGGLLEAVGQLQQHRLAIGCTEE